VLEDNNDLTSKSSDELLACTDSSSVEVFRALFRLIRVHGQLVFRMTARRAFSRDKPWRYLLLHVSQE